MIVGSLLLVEAMPAVSLSFSEILSLTKDKLEELLPHYPETEKRIKKAAVKIAVRRAAALVAAERRNGQISEESASLHAMFRGDEEEQRALQGQAGRRGSFAGADGGLGAALAFGVGRSTSAPSQARVASMMLEKKFPKLEDQWEVGLQILEEVRQMRRRLNPSAFPAGAEEPGASPERPPSSAASSGKGILWPCAAPATATQVEGVAEVGGPGDLALPAVPDAGAAPATAAAASSSDPGKALGAVPAPEGSVNINPAPPRAEVVAIGRRKLSKDARQQAMVEMALPVDAMVVSGGAGGRGRRSSRRGSSLLEPLPNGLPNGAPKPSLDLPNGLVKSKQMDPAAPPLAWGG